MITYEKLYQQYEYYKACYLRIDAYYWDNICIDSSGNINLKTKECKDILSNMYSEYKIQCAKTLEMLSDYQNSIIKLYGENVSIIRRDIADYDNRLNLIFKNII